MISDELRARIRRLYYAEHWRVGTIARELGIHHETVQRAIAEGYRSPVVPAVRPSRLDPYKNFVRETLGKHSRLRVTRLYAMVQARGYAGSIVQLRRYVQKIRPRGSSEAFLRLSTLPGEQAQVDWGSFGKLTIGHARRSLSCFVLVLSHSRAMYARFFLDQQLENFLRGHVQAFEALGGVPREILYDNLRSVVLDRVGDHVRFNPHLLELAGHYHYAPKPCAPYRGNEKGKVERTIQYLRHSFFEARDFRTLDELNAQLASWIEGVAHRRRVPGEADARTVEQALEDERERLLPLPEHAFSCDLVRAVSSGKTPYVRFDLNDYSIPHDQVGRTLTLIASDDTVRIVAADGIELARHTRSYDRRQTIESPQHLAELVRHKRQAHALSSRDRLRNLCPQADAFIEALARRNLPLSGQTHQLLRLLDHYGAAELDAAMSDALGRGAASAATVAHVLDQRARARKQKPPLAVVLPADERVQNLSVTPHALGPYDDLSRPDTEHDDDEDPCA